MIGTEQVMSELKELSGPAMLFGGRVSQAEGRVGAKALR